MNTPYFSRTPNTSSRPHKHLHKHQWMRTGQSHRWLSFPPKRPTSDCVTDPITDYRPNSPPAKLSPQTPVNDYSTMAQPAKAKQPPQTPIHAYRTKPSLPQLPPKTPISAFLFPLPLSVFFNWCNTTKGRSLSSAVPIEADPEGFTPAPLL